MRSGLKGRSFVPALAVPLARLSVDSNKDALPKKRGASTTSSADRRAAWCGVRGGAEKVTGRNDEQIEKVLDEPSGRSNFVRWYHSAWRE